MSNLTTTQKILIVLALWWLLGSSKGCVVGSPPPFKTDKLSVLIVEETDDRDDLPPSQATLIQSRLLDDAVTKSGGQIRKLDASEPPVRDAAWVQAAWAVERKSLPWIVAATPQSGTSKPLPLTLDETFTLLAPLGVTP